MFLGTDEVDNLVEGAEQFVFRSQLESQRANRLEQGGVLEKAKGVDIGLAVRILEDAHHNNFDTCFLFSSDIDFMPVARIVQRMGKKVIVFGYSDGLGARSEFEYAPDGFVDLGPYVQQTYLPKTESK